MQKRHIVWRMEWKSLRMWDVECSRAENRNATASTSEWNGELWILEEEEIIAERDSSSKLLDKTTGGLYVNRTEIPGLE